MTSTCSLSNQCGDEGNMTMCCVEIMMTSLESGETDSLSRCMTEGVVEANWEWTLESDNDEDDEMTVIMKCMDKSSAVYLKTISILAASMALIASISL